MKHLSQLVAFLRLNVQHTGAVVGGFKVQV